MFQSLAKAGAVIGSSFSMASLTQVSESHLIQPILGAGLGGILAMVLVKWIIKRCDEQAQEIQRLNKIIYNLSKKYKENSDENCD